MSDITDVENALVSLIAAALYPNGTMQASAPGVPVVVYPGWPTSSRLDADLAIGKAHVTVFPTAVEVNTTRYPRDWKQQTVNVPTLSLTIAGQTVTVGGAMPAPFTPHVLTILVNGRPYPYQVLQTDTLTSIAAALAAMTGATAVGAALTLPNTSRIGAARVGVTGTAIREVRRQQRNFQVTVWSDTPANRTAIASVIDVALAAVENMTMPDGFGARLVYRSSLDGDNQQKSKLYRRDFVYSVEYATTQVEAETQITQEQLNTSSRIDGSTQDGPVATTYF